MAMDPVTAAFNAVAALANFGTALVSTPAGQEQVKMVNDMMSLVYNFLKHKQDERDAAKTVTVKVGG